MLFAEYTLFISFSKEWVNVHNEILEIEKITKAISTSGELLRHSEISQQAIDNLKEAENSLNRALNHILSPDRNNRYT